MERVGLYLDFERPLSREEQTHFRQLLQRRLRHEPLQYILGVAEFFSLPFKVTPAVLIPRPETEVLVEHAIAYCKERYDANRTIYCLDIGTGSGNIAIALAKNIPNVLVTAIDISEDIIAIALDNAQTNDVYERINFHQVDIDDKNLETVLKIKFDLIVSNPPYINTQTIEHLDPEIKDYEPRAALDGGKEGLDFYRRLAKILPSLLTKSGIVLLEIGEAQAVAITELFKNSSFNTIQTIKDYAGLERVTELKQT